MSALVAAMQRRGNAAWLGLAGALGAVLGVLLSGSREAARALPGAAAAGCIAVGMFKAWEPLGWIAIGAVLLVLDRRIR